MEEYEDKIKKLSKLIRELGYELITYTRDDPNLQIEVMFRYYYDYMIDPVELQAFGEELLGKIRDHIPGGQAISDECYTECFFGLNPGPDYRNCDSGVKIYIPDLVELWKDDSAKSLDSIIKAVISEEGGVAGARSIVRKISNQEGILAVNVVEAIRKLISKGELKKEKNYFISLVKRTI